MRLPWQQHLPWQRHRGRHLVGVEASEEGLAIARVVRGNGGPRLAACEYVSREAVESLADALPERIEALHLTRAPCNWVLSGSQYTLLLIEAPQVPPEEMREAVRWRLKDLIAFPAEQAVVDVFGLPEDGSRGKKMLYAVAVERNRIEDAVDTARLAKLALTSIDVAEMALRNLAELASSDQRGLAVVRLRRGAGNLALIRGQQLYLSRQFELDYNAGLFDNLPEDALILELQRSLDYYERQMGQEPPSRILLCGDSIAEDKITDNMRKSLPGGMSCLDVSQLLAGAEQWDEHRLQLCLGAIGGALREEAA